MPSYFELRIKVNTLAHAPHTRNHTHTRTASRCVRRAAITAEREYFMQGQGLDRSK